MMTEFPDVWRGTPGKTDMVEHDVVTGSARPIRLPAYRLPHAYQDKVKKELDEMLVSGVIRASGVPQLYQ